MLDNGSTHGQDLVEVILTIGRLDRTGILTIQSENEIIGISFLVGKIVSADALNQPQEDGFGEVLTDMDLVSAEDYATLVAEYQAGGGRVMDLLVERGHLQRADLLAALRQYIYRLSREALSWSSFEYKFYQGQEVSHEEGIEPLEIDEFLVRAAEDLGPEGTLPGEMPGPDSVLAKNELGLSPGGRDDLLLGLATREGQTTSRLVSEMDGRRSVQQLADAVGISLNEARLAFYILVRTDQADISEAEAVTSVPAPESDHRSESEDLVFEKATEAKVEEAIHPWAKPSRSWSDNVPGSMGEWLPWVPRVLGVILAFAVLTLGFSSPSRFLLPFPWQEGLHQAVQDQQTSAAYLKIDRAAKTSFVLNGHFPESVEQLVLDGYLSESDLVDPSGRSLGYAAQIAGYLIYPLDEGEAAPGASRTETITGNFVLDAEFVPTRKIESDPLVLLD